MDAIVEDLAEFNYHDRSLLASIFADTPEEMAYVAGRLEPFADAAELNFSCRHSPGHGATHGSQAHTPTSIGEFTRAVKSRFGKPVIPKFSPNDSNEELKAKIRAAIDAGADGISLINTMGPEVFEIDGHPALTSDVGGSLSGDGIRERGFECTKIAREEVGPDVPLIVTGGLSTAEHIRKSRALGATLNGIGTALAGMSTSILAKYFTALDFDLENGTNTAEQYLVFNRSGHKKFRVKENYKYTDDLSMLVLDDGFEIEPGQFVFTWLPKDMYREGDGEKPYSLYDNDPATLVVQRRGKLSNVLANLRPGEELYLRGPCGNPVDLDIEKAILVGGGTGIASLRSIARALDERGVPTTSFLGAVDRDHISFAEESYNSGDVRFATNDGSFGRHGNITAYLLDKIGTLNLEHGVFFNCGPSQMIRSAEIFEGRYVGSESMFSSEEQETSCGYGLCARCAREDGLRSCVDGYFMNPIC